MSNDPLLQPTAPRPARAAAEIDAKPTKVCLVIVFNHRYDGNLPKLDRIYRGRFQHVRYLVPFYRGDRGDVLPVYYSSFQFEGFFRTAWEGLRGEGFTHYLFLADDMILNPRVTDSTLCRRLKLDEDTAYIRDIHPITEGDLNAFWFASALSAVAGTNGVNWTSELPAPADARANLDAKGYPMGRFGLHNFRRGLRPKALLRAALYLAQRLARRRRDRQTALLDPPYPLVNGMADILAVPAAHMEKFCTWCSVFAAMGVFVEVGAATALALSCPRLVCEADVGFPGMDWGNQVEPRDAYCRPFGNQIDKLLAGFDENVLFMHPIKLSQWQFAS